MEDLSNLRRLPGNHACADCRDPGPLEYAVLMHGILVCKTCADIHKTLGARISKVKSLLNEPWSEAEYKSPVRAMDQIQV